MMWAPTTVDIADAVDLLERFLDDTDGPMSNVIASLEDRPQLSLTLLVVTLTMCSSLLAMHDEAPFLDRRQLREIVLRAIRITSAEVLDLVDQGHL